MKTYLWVKLYGVVINTEILSMSFGLAQAASGVDLPRAAASPSVSDLKVVLPSSCPHLPILNLALDNGTHIREACITCVNKDGKGQILAHRKYRLQDVLVSSFSSSTKETAIGLNFANIEQTYRQG